jgi:chromosome segregation ATPase
MSSRNKAAETEILELQTQIAHMKVAVPDAAPEPEVIYLTKSDNTNEVTALKTQLAEKEAQIRELRSNTNRPVQRLPALPAARQSLEETMARMREEDPKGYAELIQRRNERQQEMSNNLDERTAAFMDLDTSKMTEEELANHELLVAKMTRLWEINEQFQDPEAERDREAMWEMMSVTRGIQPLLEVERSVMFKQLGADLGYEGKEAEVFATNIEAILDATGMPMLGGRGRRGP